MTIDQSAAQAVAAMRRAQEALDMAETDNQIDMACYGWLKARAQFAEVLEQAREAARGGASEKY
jgi:hypothetical protein